jgi:hypothetical protein
MREIGLVQGIAFLLELLYRRGHIHGIPDNDGIGDQQAVDRDRAKDGVDLGGMIALTALQVAAMGTGTLQTSPKFP